MIHLTKNTYKPLNVAFEAYRLFVDEHIEMVQFILQNEEIIELHNMPVKVIFYVLEGNGLFLHEHAEILVKKDDVLIVEPNSQRGWKSLSNNHIHVLVIKQL